MGNSGPNGEWATAPPGWWGDLPVIGCQVWYADGSCVHGWDGPDDGVQVVVAHHPGGYRTLCTAKDEYTMAGEAETKLGLEIDFDLYLNIHARALADEWRAG